MKHLDKTVCLLIALLAMSIPVIAQTAATVPEAETPVYEDIFASLAAIVAGVPVIVEAIRGFWKDMPGWAGVALNWVLGIGICMFGWWQELGFLCRAGLDGRPDVWHRCWYRRFGLCRNRTHPMADLALRPQEEKSMMYGLERILRLSRCRRRVDGPAQMAVRPAFCPASAEG